MADRPVINIVGTVCPPGDEQKFNEWYNEVHVPLILKSKKVQGVVRYKVAEDISERPRYIAIYKFANRKDLEEHEKSPELEAARKEMLESWGKKIEISSRIVYELVKEWP